MVSCPFNNHERCYSECALNSGGCLITAGMDEGLVDAAVSLENIVNSLDGILSALNNINTTLYDTLGGGLTGDALRAIIKLPESIDGIMYELNDKLGDDDAAN